MYKSIITKYIKPFFGIYLIIISLFIALLTFDEYGISWDEETQRTTGLMSYNYVFKNDSSIFEYKDKDYGVAFELPLIILEKKLGLTDSRSIYLIRHFATHIFFLIGCYFIYLQVNYIYNNKFLASIAFLLLILHPRIYAHSFYNTKDIPFLSMFVISMYFMIKAHDRKSIINYILFGIATGILINLRLMGVLIPFTAFIVLILDAFKQKITLKPIILFSVYLFFCCSALYISWPYLWGNPIENFIIAFENMSKFRWHAEILYFEGTRVSDDIPWTYVLAWSGITTPIIFLILGYLGFFKIWISFFKSSKQFLFNQFYRNQLIFLALFLTPIITVIVLNSTIYDGWRQLYFIYPPFVLLAIYGLSILLKRGEKHSLFAKLFISVGVFIALLTNFFYFPHQNIYFNEMYAFKEEEYLRKSFEMDYWGTSNKEALEYILENDKRDLIKVNGSHPTFINHKILKEAHRKRIKMVESKDEANYFITNFRWHPQDYKELEEFKFHSIKRNRNTICQIFKLK